MLRNGMLRLVPGERGDQPAWVAMDRYWDASVLGESLPVEGFDATLATTIRHLRDIDDAPLPDPGFAARLERELFQPGTPHAPTLSPSQPGLQPVDPHGTSPLPGWPTVTRRLAMNVGAAAALLAIVVASTVVAVWVGMLGVRAPGPSPLIIAPGITDEKVLLQARFDTIPDGMLSASVSRWVLQPGAEVALGRAETIGAAAAYRVEAGALRIRPNAAIFVTRSDAMTPTAVPESMWSTLLPGDQLFIPAGVTSLWRNEGARPVRLLEATYASRDVQPQPTGVLRYPVISDGQLTEPDRPVVMTVIEITLHPEGELPVVSVPGLAMLKVEAGRLVAIDVDGYGNPLPPVGLGQASRFLGSFPPGRVFRSGNDDPVRLLLVTIADANPLGSGR